MNNQLQMWTTQYHDETVIAYSAEDAQAVLAEYFKNVIGENEPVPDDYRWQALPMDNEKTVKYDELTPDGTKYVRETKFVYEWIDQEGRGHFSTANW